MKLEFIQAKPTLNNGDDDGCVKFFNYCNTKAFII